MTNAETVEVQGVPIHVVDVGQGPPVVLIHGSDGVLQDFTESPLLERLTPRFRVIVPDRSGHGSSGVPRGGRLDVDANVRLLRGAVRALGVDRPVVLGHSYGGTVALRWALDHPEEVAALVPLAAGAYPPSVMPRFNGLHPMVIPRFPGVAWALTRTPLRPLASRFARRLYAAAFHPDPLPASYVAMIEPFTLRPGQLRWLAEENRWHVGDMAAQAPRYPSLRVPTVVVVGSEDVMAAPDRHGRRLHRELPNSVLVEVPGSGHEVHHHDPDAVANAIALAWRMAARA